MDLLLLSSTPRGCFGAAASPLQGSRSSGLRLGWSPDGEGGSGGEQPVRGGTVSPAVGGAETTAGSKDGA